MNGLPMDPRSEGVDAFVEIDCSETLLRIFEYLDGEMTSPETQAIAHHLASCSPCAMEHNLDLAVKDMIQQACPCHNAPESLRVTIVQSITTITWHGDPR